MILSTLGFIYTPDFVKVLLIEKSKPIFHKGLLNGLGGKCEPGEEMVECITREVKEEADLNISPAEWSSFGQINWEEWQVELFAAVYPGLEQDAKSLTDDPVAWYDTSQLPSNVISNLKWLIPLGADHLKSDMPLKIEVEYSAK